MSEEKESPKKGEETDIPVSLEEDITIPGELPLLPVRNIVVFPFMILPLYVGREQSINAVNEALAKDRMIMLTAQKDATTEEPEENDLYSIGTVVMIVRMLKLPDGRVKILVQGLSKAKIEEYEKKEDYLTVKITRIDEKEYTPGQEEKMETEALMRSVRQMLDTVIGLGKQVSPDILVIAENLDDPGRLADLIGSNIGLKVEDAQRILEMENLLERLKAVSDALGKESKLLGMQQKIENAAREEMTKSQREYYLREQQKAIAKELGDIDEKAQEINEFREKIEKAKMPEEVEKEALKQLDRMSKMHAESAEATTVRTYLEWMVEIPWSTATEDNLDLVKAQKTLDEDHYDLEKVKERIIEYLAVRKLKDKMKGPILCLVGPPGVGKTSLGQSVARALGRKFVRISLGGVRDEAEIRGHRRTYIGSLPGKIIQGIKQAGSKNPVFMMDEIDKMGHDFRGDPSSALLEVLDPAQNHAFVDHYIGSPYDLTNVMFITTANMVDTIPPALLDRMEVIRLAGYTDDEKVKIAQKYIVPRQLDEHGITSKNITLSEEALRGVIRGYTREAGLRNLERNIASLCRKVAKNVASGKKKKHKIGPDDLDKFLGVQVFVSEPERERDMVGVATGLAWTSAGGVIMLIEATPMRGGGRLMLTGKLGDVMKESAQAALTYIRARAEEFGLEPDFASKTDIHIHVPAGAVPKDGPSAGITIATAITSALTGIAVRKDIAMTGEITLRGRILPIGGLKEKVLAAHRAGIFEIVIPSENEKDLAEIPDHIRKQMTFHIAKRVGQALDLALIKKPKSTRKTKTKKAAVRKKKSARSKKSGKKKKTAKKKKSAKKKAEVGKSL